MEGRPKVTAMTPTLLSPGRRASALLLSVLGLALGLALGPLAGRATAQDDLQASGARLTPGGAVAWTWDSLHVGRDPRRLARVEAATLRGIIDVRATARWIAARHTDGVALFAWADR